MENERDDQHSGKEDGPPASEDQDRPNMQSQGREGSQSGGTSGQPIGGNDSSTGSGTTLSQGADFGGQSATGQAQQNDGSGDTLTTDQSSESSSQSSQGGSQGEGFIGSQGSGSDDSLQDKVRQARMRPAAPISPTRAGAHWMRKRISPARIPVTVGRSSQRLQKRRRAP